MNGRESISNRESWRRGAGTLFFLAGAVFITFSMLSAAIATDYDFKNAAISDLGTYRETATVFNTSLAAVGLLTIAAGYGLHRAGARRIHLVIATIAGIGATGAGLFPLGRFEVHGLFALLAFVTYNVQAITLSAGLRGPAKTVGVVAGIVGLVFVVVMVLGDAGVLAGFGPIGHGGAERMIAYPAMLWLMGIGGLFMGTSS